jgi:hypothetical protein
MFCELGLTRNASVVANDTGVFVDTNDVVDDESLLDVG